MKKLSEFFLTFGRPDASGIRAKGLDRKYIDNRSDDFPYDKRLSYGEPLARGPGSQSSPPSHASITPKDISHSAWDDLEEVIDQISAEENEAISVAPMTFDPRSPDVEPVSIAEPTNWHDTTDDEIEKKLDRLLGRDNNKSLPPEPKVGSGRLLPSDIYVVATASPFMKGIGHSMNTHRGFGGLVAKESIWNELYNIFSKKSSKQ